MKRLFAILLSMLLIFGLVGCTKSVDEETTIDIISEEITSEEIEFDKNVVVDTEDFGFYVDGAELNEDAGTWSVKIFMDNKEANKRKLKKWIKILYSIFIFLG